MRSTMVRGFGRRSSSRAVPSTAAGVTTQADLDIYLDGFADLIKRTACVVSVGKTENHPLPDLDNFAARMQAKGVLNPVLAADVRDSVQVLQLLDLLLLQLEQ